MKKRVRYADSFSSHVVALVALLSLTYSLVNMTPEILVQTSAQMVANAVVGMSAGVLPNPDNTVAAQLLAKERELNEREARLAVADGGKQANFFEQSAVYSFFLSIILFVFLGINFFLDWRRARQYSRVVV